MPTSRIKAVFLMCAFFLLTACASKPLQMKEDASIETLGLCVEFNEHISAEEKLYYLNATEAFVNERQGKVADIWQLDTCNTQQKHQLLIVVQNSHFVEPSYQAFYVLLSTLGILYPLNGGAFGFFWLGFNTSNLEVSVSKELATQARRPVFRQVYSSPYFMGSDAVRLKHMESYKQTLGELIQEMQQQLKLARAVNN